MELISPSAGFMHFTKQKAQMNFFAHPTYGNPSTTETPLNFLIANLNFLKLC